jgi:hypothetical protein
VFGNTNLIDMALQCTPENIQQMMLALKASFGLVENERKQVERARQLFTPALHNFRRLQATAFLQIQQQQPGFSQILLAVISQVSMPCVNRLEDLIASLGWSKRP